MKVRTSILVIASAALLTGCATSSPETDQITDSSMLTIITSPDPQTQLMALVLTRAAMAEGEKPNILLCSAGGDLALAVPPAKYTAALQPKGVSPHGLLKTLISEGVSVDVCAIYLPNRPYNEDALLKEVGVATPAEMGEQIARPGETVLSF